MGAEVGLRRPVAYDSTDEHQDLALPVLPGERWWVPEGATLLEPLQMKRPKLSPDALALESLLISRLDDLDLPLPAMPRVSQRALRRLRDPDCSLAKVALDIAEDPAAAVAVLRLANSPLYGGSDKFTTLRAAVTELGAKALRPIMLHLSMRSATRQCGGLDHPFVRSMWRRSLASACIMNGLSAFTHVQAEDASLIGLLHDVGNVLVMRVARRQMAAPAKLNRDEFEYLCSETHERFGALIACAWELPPVLRDIISDHHKPPPPDDPARSERLQVQLTDMITAMLGYSPRVVYNLVESRVAKDLGLEARGPFIEFLAQLPMSVADAIASL